MNGSGTTWSISSHLWSESESVTSNTDGLKKSARLRSESAMQRALVALQRMDDSDRKINFRTVATEAGVSRHGCKARRNCGAVSCGRAGPPLTFHLQRRPHGIESAHLRSEERRVGKECRSRWSPY